MTFVAAMMCGPIAWIFIFFFYHKGVNLRREYGQEPAGFWMLWLIVVLNLVSIVLMLALAFGVAGFSIFQH